MAPRVPIPERRSLQRFTLVMGIVSLVMIGMTFEPLPGVLSFLWAIPGLVWFVYFVLPTVLAASALLGAAIDWPGVSAPVVGAVAALTLWTVIVSAWTLVTPTDGGGVYFGFIFISYAVGFLVLAIVARETVRLLAGDRQLPTLADLLPD